MRGLATTLPPLRMYTPSTEPAVQRAPVETRTVVQIQSAPQVSTDATDTRVAPLIKNFFTGSAQDKADKADAMLRLTEYTTLPPTAKPEMGGFAARLRAIQNVPFVTATGYDKPVHKVGSAGVITCTVTGNAPEPFKSASVGAVRLGPGGSGSIPGVGLVLFGDGDAVHTRVFASMSGSTYAGPIGQTLLGISAADAEGPLTFTAAPRGPLAAVDVKLPNQDFRAALNAIPAGTVLGTIRPETKSGSPAWEMTITLAKPMRSARAADRNWHFNRPLHGVTLGGHMLMAALKVASCVVGSSSPSSLSS